MPKAVLGKKIGMSQCFLGDEGEVVPVTLVKVLDTFVLAQKTRERDGYDATQIVAQETKRLPKSQRGILAKAGIKKNLAFSREVAFIKAKEGGKLPITQFREGENVKVSGKAKGKGFAGTVKRHGFTIGPKSHGSKNVRAPGSIGSTYPQRVIKGKKMAGHMGAGTSSVKNLEIVDIDAKKGVMALKGSVPGARKSLVLITKV